MYIVYSFIMYILDVVDPSLKLHMQNALSHLDRNYHLKLFSWIKNFWSFVWQVFFYRAMHYAVVWMLVYECL